VHSLKDLPTVLPAGIELAAVGSREDPRDALVGRWPLGLAALGGGATVATSSLRRRAQLLRARPDLRVVEVRGNVDSRLAQLDRSREWAAIVLASAGLVRLGLAHRIGERLPLDLLLPAPGQGALGVTVRAGDGPTSDAVRRALHERTTALCVAAERAFLRRLEGGCQVPVGAHAQVLSEPGGTPALRLQGRVVSLDGRRAIEGSLTLLVRDEGAAADLGARLADRVLADGAAAILEQVRAALPPSEAGAA
jgi:hydroxymethylbilane synthase